MHAGIAEVAAAKARMFVNKPDGSTLLTYVLEYNFNVLDHIVLYNVKSGNNRDVVQSNCKKKNDMQ